MSLKYCEVCDTYEEYSRTDDVLSCGHRPDNPGGQDETMYNTIMDGFHYLDEDGVSYDDYAEEED